MPSRYISLHFTQSIFFFAFNIHTYKCVQYKHFVRICAKNKNTSETRTKQAVWPTGVGERLSCFSLEIMGYGWVALKLNRKCFWHHWFSCFVTFLKKIKLKISKAKFMPKYMRSSLNDVSVDKINNMNALVYLKQMRVSYSF